MSKQFFNILKYILFLALGGFIFWFIYRKQDPRQIIGAFREVNYFWIFMSLVFSVLSIVSRAVRWQLLIKSIGHKTRFVNVFLSCYVLYLVNLFVPRAGEVARCALVSGSDNVPFAKLVGTMLVERLADFVMLVVLAVIIFTWNISTIRMFFDTHPEMTQKIEAILSTRNIILIGILGMLMLAGLVYLWRKRRARAAKKESLWSKLKEGIYSIAQLDNKWTFIGHTAFIYLMWLAMLYVVFLAYGPTAHLSIRTGMVTFLMGGLAMLAPIQGGIGPWHFMVYQTLFIYAIPIEQGKIFAFIAHTTTNLVYIVLGAIALIVLFLINSGKISLSGKAALKK
ncbi:MAG: flippase-like domain-containing protein [Bacteroidales bacterium]|nr:flippase-like domain-containing protein [Bacteroidales bacterium]